MTVPIRFAQGQWKSCSTAENKLISYMGKKSSLIMGIICAAALGFAIGYVVVLAFSGHIAIKDIYATAMSAAGALAFFGSIAAVVFASDATEEAFEED